MSRTDSTQRLPGYEAVADPDSFGLWAESVRVPEEGCESGSPLPCVALPNARVRDAAPADPVALRLDRHETHPRPLHRFGNGFGIQVVALIRLHVGLHVLRRHQSHFMTLFAQRPPQKVRSTTGLHADQLHLQIRGEGLQLPARTSLADHHPASRIQSNQMKDRLTQINA